MRNRRKWTAEEDQILRREALAQMEKGQLKQWNLIAASLPGRTNKDCRKRWTKLGNNVIKGAWSSVEDEKLQGAVQELGCRWTEVAKRVGTRHAEQCAKRWQNSLDPTVDHSKWGEEDEKLLGCVQLCGRNWTTIREKYFPNRSTTDLKNRYTTLTRKQLHAAESSAPNLDPDLASNSAIEIDSDGNEDDEDDESESDNNDDNNGGEALLDSSVESHAADSNLELASLGQPNPPRDFFLFRDIMSNPQSYTDHRHDINGPFFSPSSNSVNDFVWSDNLAMTMSMSDPSVQNETGTSQEGQSQLHAFQIPKNFGVGVGNPESLLASDSDLSQMDVCSELIPRSSSQTTLILDNVRPETLKHVLYVLIDANTKMTMKRSQ